MQLIILVILVVLLFGVGGTAPLWPYSSGWGYVPSSVIGLLLVIVLIYVLTGGGRL